MLPDELARAGVTSRQAEVFWLVADRLRNREIADRLAISVRTVDSHVVALLTKLAAADRSQLVAMAARIRGRTAPRQPLPRPLDSFVRRDQELEELRTQVATRRLVTLVGPPGAGKSRLALELARSARTQPPAVFVDLAAVQSDQDLPHAFLDAVGVARTSRPAREALVEALAAGDVWLVVDNCEHVGEAVGALLHDLLSSTDTLWVLATSQRPLRVAGEVVFPVGPLAVPPDTVESATELLASPAGQLFADRAGAAVTGFDVAADPQSVAALCRRLDGLPLAIELAAARMRTFTAHELLARLDDRFLLLGEGAHGRLPRQRTLEAAIAWSYDRLSEIEQSVLQRLSVFPAGFQYDDVVAMANLRDAAMAENVEWILQREDRIVIGAANGHIQREPFLAPPFVTQGLTMMGQHLAASLGEQIVIIASTFGGGTFWLHRPGPDSAPGHSEPFVDHVDALAPDSLDALLSSPGLPLYLLDLREVPREGSVAERFAATNSTMNGPHPQLVNPMAAFDAAVYIDRLTPWHTFIDTPT